MSNMTIEQLANLAAETEDQTVDTGGGDYEYKVPPAGVTVAVFKEYIETGKHPQKPYQGKAKPDAEMVELLFELTHPVKNKNEYEIEGEKMVAYDTIRVRMAKKTGEKAAFKKLFNAMTYGRADKKHMAQMLGEGFLVTVIHAESGEGDNKRTYANLRNKEGTWFVNAPRTQADPLDPESQPKAIKVPEGLRPVRIFLWDNPTKETWDSLFIDGTRTVKDGNKETQISKNWLQEKIMSAKNFQGSPLDAMLNKLTDLNLDEPKEDKQPGKGDTQTQTGGTSTASVTSAEQPKANAAKKATTASPSEIALQELDGPADEVDDLAALGLN